MPSLRRDVEQVLDTAKRLMEENPRLGACIALYRAGNSSSSPRAAGLLDDLLPIDERFSTDTKTIDHLYSRPEVRG
jgi:hypothetical protein